MHSKFAVPIVAAAVTAAALTIAAAPGFAGEYRGHRHHYRHHYYQQYPGTRDYSGYLDPRSGHYDPQFQRNRENFGFSGRDPSRVGGIDPSLNPAPLGR